MGIKSIPVFVESLEHDRPVRLIQPHTDADPVFEILPNRETISLTLNILDELVTVSFTGDKAREVIKKLSKVMDQAG